MSICIPDEPGDSPEWDKKFEVFSISRLFLESLGFSNEHIAALTNEDLQILANSMSNGMHSIFVVTTKLVTERYLKERGIA